MFSLLIVFLWVTNFPTTNGFSVVLRFTLECAKFRGSRGFSASCLCESKIFYRGYFLGVAFFLAGFSWVQIILAGIRGSKILFRGYFVGQKSSSWLFVGPEIFLVGTLWIQNFLRGYLVGPISFLFKIQRFSIAGCMSKSDKNGNTKILVKPRILF